jgi:peptidoglycan-associated lipoprotein
MNPKLFMAIAVTAVSVGASGCASKKFVRDSVAQVNEKADSLGRGLEDTQERVRRNETRIGEVDQKATQAGTAAASAQTSAERASGAATSAASAAAAANAAATTLDANAKKLVYELVLSENEGNFSAGGRALPDSAKAKLDALIARLTSDPKAAFFEIEGHTDSTGSAAANARLGEQRADAVKRYLYEKHSVPLHKMNTISYGDTRPVGDNKTRDGRAQNRRIVVRIVG